MALVYIQFLCYYYATRHLYILKICRLVSRVIATGGGRSEPPWAGLIMGCVTATTNRFLWQTNRNLNIFHIFHKKLCSFFNFLKYLFVLIKKKFPLNILLCGLTLPPPWKFSDYAITSKLLENMFYKIDFLRNFAPYENHGKVWFSFWS